MKSGNLNFLELSGPLQACNGTALPLPAWLTAILSRSSTQHLNTLHRLLSLCRTFPYFALIPEQKHININLASTRFLHYTLIPPPVQKKEPEGTLCGNTCLRASLPAIWIFQNLQSSGYICIREKENKMNNENKNTVQIFVHVLNTRNATGKLAPSEWYIGMSTDWSDFCGTYVKEWRWRRLNIIQAQKKITLPNATHYGLLAILQMSTVFRFQYSFAACGPRLIIFTIFRHDERNYIVRICTGIPSFYLHFVKRGPTIYIKQV